MKRFLLFCLLLCLPILALAIVYIVIDPFKVIWKYEAYYEPDDVIHLNRGYVSAMQYINTKDSCKYNSFIFGNSKSIAYHEKEWKQYLPSSSVCYHFDEHGGAIGHLFHEIDYISRHGNIDNALIVIDCGVLSRMGYDALLFKLCPALNHNKKYFSFQSAYFKAFYNIGFLRAYIDYMINKEYKPYMGDYIINRDGWWFEYSFYNLSNNEWTYVKHEESIARGDYFDAKRVDGFHKTQQFPDSISAVVIDDERLSLLKSIKERFDNHHTNYRIVISPDYDQIKINPSDLQCLNDVFGSQYVFDFTGVNKWTKDYHFYYDNAHYRSCVANDIMRLVYTSQP